MKTTEKKEWIGNSRFYISANRNGELPIYSNGLNMLKVLVYIVPIGPDREPLTESDLSDLEIRQSLTLIDYGDNTALIKNPVLDDEGRPKEEGWYYADSSNGFDYVPDTGFPRTVENSLSLSADTENSVRIIDFYINCRFHAAGRTKRVAAQVTLPNGNVIRTSATNPGSSSSVDIRTKAPLIYTAADCKIDPSSWEKVDVYNEPSNLENKAEELWDFRAKKIFIRPTTADKSFLKSEIISSDKTDNELEILKNKFFRYDLKWLRRYNISTDMVLSYYAWNINQEEEGDTFGTTPNRYKLLGRGSRHNFAKIPIPIPISTHRVPGSFQVLVVKQIGSGGSPSSKSYSIQIVLFDQYGNKGKFKINMSETDTSQEPKITLFDR